MTYWDRIGELVSGPAHLRFFIQPLVAILLGLKDGRQDAARGREPYLLALIVHRGRLARFAEGLKSFAKVLTFAIVLDGIAQYLILRDIWLWAAVVTGLLLIALPYSGARGLANRAVRIRQRRTA